MIISTYPSTRTYHSAPRNERKHSWSVPPQGTSQLNFQRAIELSTARNISVAEFWRRNAVILKLFKDSKLIKGRVYMPLKDDKKEEYGACTVVDIIPDYFTMPLTQNEWPPNDNPMIVTFKPSKPLDIELCLCSVNFLDDTKECSC